MAAAVPGPLLRAIAAARAWLDQLGVPSAVVGGIAASLLGRPRVTKDVDLVALVPDSEWQRLLDAGRAHGIEPRAADALAFAKVSRVLLLRHELTADSATRGRRAAARRRSVTGASWCAASGLRAGTARRCASARRATLAVSLTPFAPRCCEPGSSLPPHATATAMPRSSAAAGNALCCEFFIGARL